MYFVLIDWIHFFLVLEMLSVCIGDYSTVVVIDWILTKFLSVN